MFSFNQKCVTKTPFANVSPSGNPTNTREPGCRTGTLIYISSRGWSRFLPSSGEFSSPACMVTRLSLQYNSKFTLLTSPLTLIGVSSCLYTNLAFCNHVFESKVRQRQHLSGKSFPQDPYNTARSIFNNMRSGRGLGRDLLWWIYQIPGSWYTCTIHL